MVLVLLAVLPPALAGRFLIAVNISESVEPKLFIVPTGRQARLERGKFVAFRHDGSAWGLPADALWVKKVAGLPGDEIRVDGVLGVHVAGRRVGALSTGSMRRGGLTANEHGRVPPGALFVVGGHSDSLDSRYAQFGFLLIENVVGEAIPVSF